MSADLFERLIDTLRGAPHLPGALCVGRWQMFDEADDPVITEAAVELCNACPVLDRCRDWVDSLPARRRPAGVIAGRVNPRPRKAANPRD